MRTFSSLLPRHPIATAALSCALLDRAGVDPDALRSGVSVVEAPGHVDGGIAEAIDAFVFGGKSSWGAMNDSGVAVILAGHVEAVTFRRALARGLPTVVVTDFGNVPPEADIHADRRCKVDGDLTDDIVRQVVQVVAGEDVSYLNFDGIAGGVTVEQLTATARPGVPATISVARLRQIADLSAKQAAEATAKALAEMAKADTKRAAKDSASAAEKDDDENKFVPLADVAKATVTKLSDLTGFGDARAWGLQLAADLRAYDGGLGSLAWDDVDRGVLLAGPPGCGKTFFAQVLAAECGVPLIVTGYSSWMAHKDARESASRAIKKTFEEARKKAPCIVFIDELDSVGARGANGYNESYWTSVINSLLAELDGAEPRRGVVVIAATNHPDKIDPALLRPGRLERTVEISAPRTLADLAGVITHHAPGLGDDDAARACRGLSPATIAMVCREARRAARRDGREPTSADVVAAARALGPQRSDSDDGIVAIHEAAHAVAYASLGLDLRYASIGDPPHVSSAFATIHATRDYVERHIVATLAARRADAMLGNGVTVAASSDLEAATTLARQVVVKWGMWGSIYALSDGEASLLPRDIKGDVEALLEALDIRAAKLVDENRSAIIRIAEALRSRRYLDADEVRALVSAPEPEVAR